MISSSTLDKESLRGSLEIKEPRDTPLTYMFLLSLLVLIGCSRQAQTLLKDPTVEEADKDRLTAIFDAIKSTLKVIDDCANVILGPGDIFGRKRRPAL